MKIVAGCLEYIIEHSIVVVAAGRAFILSQGLTNLYPIPPPAYTCLCSMRIRMSLDVGDLCKLVLLVECEPGNLIDCVRVIHFCFRRLECVMIVKNYELSCCCCVCV